MPTFRFVFCKGGTRWHDRAAVFDFLKVNVPEGIAINESNDDVRRWAYNLLGDRHGSDSLCFSERHLDNLAVAAIFSVPNWDTMEGKWFKTPKTPDEALYYINKIGRSPDAGVEHLVAQKSETAEKYAIDILRNRFPLGEPAIAKDSSASLRYALRFGRFKEGEATIAQHEYQAEKYGEMIRASKVGWSDWTEEEVMRSPVWLFQYAKDYMKGSLPETMHQAMQMFSFNHPNNSFVKRYFSTKRYKFRKRRKKKEVTTDE